jgi:predicted membrane channel-forming protein YqfA (hemolysin III family)
MQLKEPYVFGLKEIYLRSLTFMLLDWVSFLVYLNLFEIKDIIVVIIVITRTMWYLYSKGRYQWKNGKLLSQPIQHKWYLLIEFTTEAGKNTSKFQL